jgi:hydroxyethylthiazole kinase-like uncharacterized protein yjeF
LVVLVGIIFLMITTISEVLVQKLLPSRPSTDHKGNFGSALLVAGSRRYTGAALLAGQACLRSGPGLVFLGIPSCLHAALSASLPEAIWEILPSKDGALTEEAASKIPGLLQGKTAWMMGSGLGQMPATERFIATLFTQTLMQLNTRTPLLLDADALNLMARLPHWANLLPQPVILTPHHKEMSRLTGCDIEEIKENPIQIAKEYSASWHTVLVLKGSSTVIADPEGEVRLLDQPTSSLAHGGTGDVLAGIITGLLAQSIKPLDAATIGVFVHNLAARLAEREIGWPGSVLPSDLIRHLGKAYALIAST